MRRRSIRWILLAALIVGATGLVASFLPFVRPANDQPTRADAVVVLAGDWGERLALGLRLVRAGVAPTLVLAGQPDSEEADRLCQRNLAFEIVCLRPSPDSTRNEARAAGRLARTRGWHRLVVATSTTHVTRSRLLFERCVDGDVQVVGAARADDLRTRVRFIVHEWLGTAHALTFERGC